MTKFWSHFNRPLIYKKGKKLFSTHPKCNHNFLLSLTCEDGRLTHAGDVCQRHIGPHIKYPFYSTINITEIPDNFS